MLSMNMYDLMKGDDEDWKRYDTLLTKLSEDFDANTIEENTKERLDRFYKLIEEAVITIFEKKEAFKTDEEKKPKKGNKIPKHIRAMLKNKKTKMSKKDIIIQITKENIETNDRIGNDRKRIRNIIQKCKNGKGRHWAK